jgi:hypothetical protein
MEGKVCRVEMESGDSGYCVKCYCKVPVSGAGDYDMPMMKDYEYNFSEKDSKAAFDKFLELDKMKKGDD